MLAVLLFAASLLVAGPGTAQDAPADAAPAATVATPAEPPSAAAQLEEARIELDRLRDAVLKAQDDDARLAELKVDVDAVAKRVIAASVATRPRLDEVKARLTELGPVPAEGEPPEAQPVAEERARLTTERGAINALTGEAENLSIDATRLSNGITETRRALFSNTLLKNTDISVAMFAEAGQAFSNEASALSRSVRSWISFVWNYKRIRFLAAIFLSLSAALIFFAGTRRLFAPVFHRDPDTVDPGYITRLTLAFWSTVIPTMATFAFAISSSLSLRWLNVLRPDISPIIAIILAVATALVFISTLTSAVLAPRHPNWRLVRVSNRGARALALAIFAMAFVNGLDYVFGGISEAMGSPVVLTVVKSLVASIVIGIILVSMALIRPVLPQGGDALAAGQPWPRLVSVAFVVGGLTLIAAALSGYVGLAKFISTQIVITGAVLVAMYIGLLTGKAISRQNAFAETLAGKFLERRFNLGQVSLDQLGLVAGLGIYILVVLFFIPLVLLQWGFQPADIQSFAYRLVTEITIGNISISLVGILGGILLFAAGFVITRWFQRWLDGNVMARSRIDAGVRNSVKTGVGYLGIGLAGLIGISAAGIDLSSLALVAGALSLGVGFGLQNIVSNFVSGLILLVERPFKVGDWVVTGTTEGFVKRISVRATEIETFQRQSIMVPNSLFINASVGNWTHRNRLGRADIPIIIGYDTAPKRIIEILQDIADAHPTVLKNPAPVAVFAAFGETTMTFELRVYLADIVNGIGVRNDLRVAIYERFRAEGIGAPFPNDLEDDTTDVPEVGDGAGSSAETTLPALENGQPIVDAVIGTGAGGPAAPAPRRTGKI